MGILTSPLSPTAMKALVYLLHYIYGFTSAMLTRVYFSLTNWVDCGKDGNMPMNPKQYPSSTITFWASVEGMGRTKEISQRRLGLMQLWEF